jgi:hypothetical protein
MNETVVQEAVHVCVLTYDLLQIVAPFIEKEATVMRNDSPASQSFLATQRFLTTEHAFEGTQHHNQTFQGFLIFSLLQLVRRL